jgi:hypothetical protein
VTGNTVYVGATGGGVWVSTNAANSSVGKVVFKPLADRPGVLGTAEDGSISIGALTVQPGGTGVILAGTGDPNDALDSYYGAGLLLSTDSGNTWSLIQGTSDRIDGISAVDHGFIGEGFAGFAWSTKDSQTVVAAVSQSYDSFEVDAEQSGYSYAGLYYSTDSGAHWHLSTIVDPGGQDVQGPSDPFAGADGNSATAVVWNSIRKLFVAAVRFHGYYESGDGITWTRMASQPGPGLTPSMCPSNAGMIGSPACPIFRGAVAVDPITGDTFAWTVDENNQDQGLWQDACTLNDGACGSAVINFATQLATTALEVNTMQGAVTIANGDYNLVLAAVPSGNDTMVLAGANDLWKCSLAAGCAWRNTTNSTSCMSAQVGEYQHALGWNGTNPPQIIAGNDSGLWRSDDGIGETGPVCSSTDADHWQNLNGVLGSLAEVESMSQIGGSPYTLMTGLGVNGTAGVRSTTGAIAQWPQILGGEGGPVAIDPVDPDNWYVNNGAGVSIHLCKSTSACTPTDFGETPVVSNADVANDGLTMTEPATFKVDPVDSSQLLVATCRLWRGPAIPGSWTSANAVTPMLGSGSSGSYCSGNPLIRSVAAAALNGGGEVVYAGAFGTINGGATLSGHVLKTTMSSAGTWSGWTDLTPNPVVNDTVVFNAYGLDVSSVVIDPHDTSGQTIYVTIAGIPDNVQDIRLIYRSTDGGAHWKDITSLVQFSPANALVVDPVDAETLYLASDMGVYATQHASTCGDVGVKCWFAYGAGLPESPVTALSASPATTSPNVLVAGTYGRGVWEIPLLTAGVQMASATVSPASLDFEDQGQGTASDPQAVTLTNQGAIALLPTAVSTNGDFAKLNDNCSGAIVNTGESCTIGVMFSPTRLGSRTGQLTIQGNIGSGNVTVALIGTGVAPPQITLQPTSIDFGSVEAGVISAAEQITAENSGGFAASISSITVSGPFVLMANGCGSTSLAPNADCQLSVEFTPTTAGPASGALTMVDSGGTQTVQLSGTGTALPTDTLSTTSLTFSDGDIGVQSAAQSVGLTNSGGNELTSIVVSVSGPFQQTNNCAGQLAPGALCEISVTYSPTTSGAQAGTLTVSDILRTQTVSLNGTGFDFGATVGSASQTVASGQTASYSVTLKPAGGLAGTFTFACSSLPQYAACSFSPSSLSVDAGSSKIETVQITTTESSAQLRRPAWPSAALPLSLACGLLLIPLAGRRRRVLLLVVLVALCASAFTSCSGSGGGGGGQPPPPTPHNTAPGTYSVTLAVTSGGVQHNITLTLVVN